MQERPAWPRALGGWPGRKIGLVAAAAVLIAAGSVAVGLSWHAMTSAPRDASKAGVTGQDGQVATRNLAGAWVAAQVSGDAVVSCDRVMCAAAAAQGFPAGQLRVLGSAARPPLRSAVVIATAEIRGQFGASLGSKWAPTVIASFGSGNSRIDIRAIAPRGAAAYRAALNADLLARKTAGSGLLGSRQMVASAKARSQLRAGQVDSRLLLLLRVLVAQHPVDVLGFGNVAPGGSVGLPLRFADLATKDAAAHLAGSGYLRSILALLRGQNPPYLPAHATTVRLASGQRVLRIEFAAPSPLGLLSSQS